MKTKRLTFITLVLIILSSCSKDDDLNLKYITSEIIPDTLFFKYLLDNFDTNKDGKISQEEADAVKEINYAYDEYQDVSISGIEYFKNLERLSLKGVAAGDTLNISNQTGLKESYLHWCIQ